MKKIMIVGTGNIGSRHLQALKAVKIPLDITVIDTNPESLQIAEERYKTMPKGEKKHKIKYCTNYDGFKEELDIAIIATHSTIRREIIEQLLEMTSVKSFILEKILFNKSKDYFFVKNLINKHNSQAWINCTRRLIPFYKNEIKNWFKKKKIIFNISGSQWKLMSNLIHLTDLLAFILEDNEFRIDYNNLDLNLIKSNIPNFYEINGSLEVYFSEGSLGIINCFSTGIQPTIIDIASDQIRCIINEREGKTMVNSSNKIGWEVFDSRILYTSQLTTLIVEDILEKNTCELTSYEESMNLHLLTYEPLLHFLNEKLDKNWLSYPFT